jgi:tRNA dimethylallyltransferase
MKKVLITIVGPTAVGKTDLAIKLANLFNTEIISADSRQFYKELNIGTAKPSKLELESNKHHLINNISINDDYNISQFQNDADKIILDIFSKNKYAILVGGSGLYIDAVLYGIDKIPKVRPSVRKKLNDEFERNGLKSLTAKLTELDPESLKTIDINNPRRVIRALEVTISTKLPYSSFLKTKNQKSKYNEIIIGLNKDRAQLHNLINTRVDQMIQKGLVEEVRSLIKSRNKNALNTIGYSEIFNYLDNEYSHEMAVEKIKTNSRRYAKRQLTWFNSNKSIRWFNNEYDLNEIVSFIKLLDD